MGDNTEEVKAEIKKVIHGMVDSFTTEVLAMSAEQISEEFFWSWDVTRTPAANLYLFFDALALHRRRWRMWEEHHNGSCCIVERVRDKYIMPRIYELLAALEAYEG